MKPRRVLEDVLVPAVIVAAPPATVSQRTCLEHFGIGKHDFLRMASRGAFAVKVEGQLRIAKYADVEAYLTGGANVRAKPIHRERKPADAVKAYDSQAFFDRAGFRKT
jgi:hypothetical protein